MKIRNKELWDRDLSDIERKMSVNYARLIGIDAEKWADAMERAMENGPLSADTMYDCMPRESDMTCMAAYYAAKLLRNAWEYGAEIERLWSEFCRDTELMF